MRPLLFALAAGVLQVTAYPPWELGFMALPAMALLVYGIGQSHRWWQAGGAGFIYGLGFFGLLIYWLSELGWIALVPLLLVLSLYPALYGLVLFLVRSLPTWGYWSVVVGAWAGMEFVRVRFPLQGFSWGLLGHTAVDLSVTRSLAAVVGVSGLSVLIIGLGAWLALLFQPDRNWVMLNRLGAGFVSGLAGLWIISAVISGQSSEDSVQVAIVQGSTPCVGSRCENERYRTYQQHLELTRSLLPGEQELVVWPESSTGGPSADPVLNPEVHQSISAEAIRLRATILVGGDRILSEEDWKNVNVVFGPDGKVVGEYQKQHPVPFGEYIPARDWFGWVEELSAVPRDMVRGSGPVTFDTGFGEFGSVISFEGSFSRYGRQHVRAGARVLVLATNQGSYPFSPASDQFLGITRLRAVELGIPIVHAAITGRSTLIDRQGNYGEVTEKGVSVIVSDRVTLDDGSLTPYARWGDWLQILAMVLAGFRVATLPFQRLWLRLRET